ncbi:hypothetical protein Hanom_Chr05g00416221 [Helianthus anomalus]
MKVSTESIRASASCKGCAATEEAVADVASRSFLSSILLLHPTLFFFKNNDDDEQEQGDEMRLKLAAETTVALLLTSISTVS